MPGVAGHGSVICAPWEATAWPPGPGPVQIQRLQDGLLYFSILDRRARRSGDPVGAGGGGDVETARYSIPSVGFVVTRLDCPVLASARSPPTRCHRESAQP